MRMPGVRQQSTNILLQVSCISQPSNKTHHENDLLVKVLGIATLAAVASIATSQAQTLIHHWDLEEQFSDLSWQSGAPFNGNWGIVTDAYDTQGGAYLGFNNDATGTNSISGGSALDNLVGKTGPGNGDNYAFEFEAINAGTYTNRIYTYQTDAVPTTGDFSIYVSFNTSYDGFQGHLFSNNAGQAGRANLYVENGRLKWFLNNGSSFVLEETTPTDVADGDWHVGGIAKNGDDWDLVLDGNIIASGSNNQSPSATAGNYWTIGGAKTGANLFDGLISDVKVYDGYIVIPEPGSFALLGLGLGALVLVRRRRH
jgi:hypothetical protein